MTVNKQHAFASGTVFGPVTLPGWKQALYRWLDEKMGISSREWEHYQVRTCFEKNARLSDAVLLGPNAWCVNGTDQPENIRLEGRVVCRGILRVEKFGAGQLYIAPNVYLGDDTLISCASGVRIGANTLIAHGVQIFDNNTHPLQWQERRTHWRIIFGELPSTQLPPIDTAPIEIEEDVWIGMNSLIMKGVRIGARSIVAAGSVVIEDVPPDTLVAGSPARCIRQLTSEVLC